MLKRIISNLNVFLSRCFFFAMVNFGGSEVGGSENERKDEKMKGIYIKLIFIRVIYLIMLKRGLRWGVF